MHDSMLIHGADDAQGPGLAPLLVVAVVVGFAAGASSALLGAGWWLVIVSYWLGGTAGLLAAAALACGVLRLPRPRLPVAPDFGFAPLRRARN